MIPADLSALRDRLDAIEVPDCDCPKPEAHPTDLQPTLYFHAPCEHILKCDHPLAVEDWADLLEYAWPDEYAEPPAPAVPVSVFTSEARVAAMHYRHAHGQGLYHPDDRHIGRDVGEDDVGIVADPGRNGALGREGQVIQFRNGENRECKRAA